MRLMWNLDKEQQEQMAREVALATEWRAKQEEKRAKLPNASRRPSENSVVIIDDNTLLRNNVRMKKAFLAPDDWFDRRYIWCLDSWLLLRLLVFRFLFFFLLLA